MTVTGIAHLAVMKKPAPSAQRESSHVKGLAGYVTQRLNDATTRSGVRMGQMKRTAMSASLETSTVGPTCASLRRGAVTARRTA